jgi:hypothetical protein
MDNRVLIWQRPGQEWIPPCLNPGRSVCISLMIWGCITYEGVGTLTVVDSNINAQKYCSREFWCFFYNTLVIFCFIQFSLNSSIRYRSSPIYSLKILVTSWSERFLSDLTTAYSFRVSRGVNKDGLPNLSLFSTVPRCLERFKTPYIAGSGCPVSNSRLQCQKRLAWCKLNKHKTVNDFWKKVIYSDECDVELGMNNRVLI